MKRFVRSSGWPGHRWWAAVLLLCAVQLGLIWWFGEAGGGPVRPPGKSPTLRLTGTRGAELLAVLDPTVFVLPHPRSFAGRAWLNATRQEAPPFYWSEEPQSLRFSTEQLGIAKRWPAGSNLVNGMVLAGDWAPEVLPPAPARTVGAPAESALRVAGKLGGRRLLTSFDLHSWTNAEFLTNTVVQLVVGPDGRTVSATLFSGSGLSAADRAALQDARKARFEPLPNRVPDVPGDPLAGLAWGQLIFEWQTVLTPKPKSTAPR